MTEYNQQNERGTENKFEFTYTAPTERERKEVEALKKQYETQTPTQKSKVEQLRALDAKVKNPPQVLALTLGIVGTLIFGLGFTSILEWGQYVVGTAIAVIGLIPLALAYPLYNRLLQKLKNKHREEILRLSEEILNGEE